MNKVVINVCYGGFGLSEKTVNWLAENAREELRNYIAKLHKDGLSDEDIAYNIEYEFEEEGIQRHDKDLVRCVEELGDSASGSCSELVVTEINGNMYRIDEYDGLEMVIEPEDYKWIRIEE